MSIHSRYNLDRILWVTPTRPTTVEAKHMRIRESKVGMKTWNKTENNETWDQRHYIYLWFVCMYLDLCMYVYVCLQVWRLLLRGGCETGAAHHPCHITRLVCHAGKQDTMIPRLSFLHQLFLFSLFLLLHGAIFLLLPMLFLLSFFFDVLLFLLLSLWHRFSSFPLHDLLTFLVFFL